MKHPLRVLSLALVALSYGIACGHKEDTLQILFRDEIVEAPARTVDFVAYAGTNCDAILSKRHDESAMANGGTVLARRSTHYPANPSAGLLDALPRGMPFAIDVATYDRDQLLMGRGCAVITLDVANTTRIDLEMRPLPKCAQAPSTLDIAVVFDASNAIILEDPSNVHLSEFDQRIMLAAARFPAPAFWSVLVDDDPDGPKELLAPTIDTSIVQRTIASLAATPMGNPRLYDGVTRAGRELRARAVCGTRPAIVAFLGDREQKPGPGAREDAVVQIVATRGDSTDDIYIYGLALSNPAYDELNDMIPLEVGTAAGAQGDLQIRMKMDDIGTALQKLIP